MRTLLALAIIVVLFVAAGKAVGRALDQHLSDVDRAIACLDATTPRPDCEGGR